MLSAARGMAPAPPWMAMAYMRSAPRGLSSLVVAEDSHRLAAVEVSRGAQHSGGVEVHDNVAVSVDGDQAAGVGGGVLQLVMDHRVDRLLQRQMAVVHQRAYVVGDDAADEVLARAGAGYGARLV